MDRSYGLVAIRLYVTRDENPSTPLSDDAKRPDEIAIPDNLVPYIRGGRPNLDGLVEQGVDEALSLGRLGVATCGNRSVNLDVKNAVMKHLKPSMPDIYCHAEEFDY